MRYFDEIWEMVKVDHELERGLLNFSSDLQHILDIMNIVSLPLRCWFEILQNFQ